MQKLLVFYGFCKEARIADAWTAELVVNSNRPSRTLRYSEVVPADVCSFWTARSSTRASRQGAAFGGVHLASQATVRGTPLGHARWRPDWASHGKASPRASSVSQAGTPAGGNAGQHGNDRPLESLPNFQSGQR